MARPLPVFGSVRQMTQTGEAPHNVRVFENGRFLYAAFYGGREMILDVRAHDRMDLLQYWHEWMKPAPTPDVELAELEVPVELAAEDEDDEPDTLEMFPGEHVRTPESSMAEEPPGMFLTSLGSKPEPPKRRMTLEEFLVA